MKKYITLLLIAITMGADMLYAQSVTHFSSSFQRNQTASNGFRNEWKDIKVDSQGNAYVLMYMVVAQDFNSQTYSPSMLLIKYNASGTVQWVINNNTPASTAHRGSLLLDVLENPIIVGYASITKYDKTSGSISWQNIATSGGGTYGGVEAAATTPTGEMFLVMKCVSLGGGSFESIVWGNVSYTTPNASSERHLLIKTDSMGTPLWYSLVKFNSTTEFTDGDVDGIVVGDSNKVYIAGSSDLVSDEGIFVSEIDSAGNFQWSLKTGDNYNDDKAHDILYHQGSIYLTGKVGNLPLDFGNGVNSTENISQSFIVKITSQGTALWMRRNENSGFPLPFRLYNLASLPNGNVAVLGNFKGANVTFCGNVINSSGHPSFPSIKQDDAAIYEFDTAGTLLSSFSTEETHTKVQVLAAAPDNSLWFGGTYNQALKIGSDVLPQLSGNSDYNFFIARVQPASITTTVATFTSQQTTITVFPNPAGNFVAISNITENSNITITDITGKTVYCKQAAAAQHMVDVSNFTQGVYIVKVSNANGVTNSRLVVQKF